MLYTLLKIFVIGLVNMMLSSSVIQYHHHICQNTEYECATSICLFHVDSHEKQDEGNGHCSHEHHQGDLNCSLHITNACLSKKVSTSQFDHHTYIADVILHLHEEGSIYAQYATKLYLPLNTAKKSLTFLPVVALRAPPIDSLTII